MTTTTPPAGDTKTFAELGLEPDLVEALDAQGIKTPFPIQEMTLGLALAGADIIGQARTGTGKTLGFGLPMLQRIDFNTGDHVRVLVIVPTRELCMQVAEDLKTAGKVKGARVLAVYGGKSLEPQMDALSKGGVHVVVGTPGRLLDLVRRGVLDLSTVSGLVLDEADEMLDLGFLPDVEQLIEATRADRQTLLFSATMPSAVVALARRYMNKPTFLRADVEEIHIAPETEQHFFSCHRMDKPAVLARILQSPNRGLCVVFSRTKRMCDILAEELRERGIAAAPIHSDLRQESRERALNRFRDGKVDVLVATEVAARGLDIDDVTHVVNYDCPDDEKMYLHRIGRTGRAGAAGVAITLAMWNELARLNMIKKALGIEVETHEVFSTSPILDELFDLPPRAERVRPAVQAKPAAGPKRPAANRPTQRASRDDDAKPESSAQPRRRRRSRSAGERAPTADVAATPTVADEPSDAPRVRRRVRSRAAAETAASPATPPATDPESSVDAGAAPADTTRDRDRPERARTRTRTRTRSTDARSHSGRPGADGSGRDDRADTQVPLAKEATKSADPKRSDSASHREHRGSAKPSPAEETSSVRSDEGRGRSRRSRRSGGRGAGGAGRGDSGRGTGRAKGRQQPRVEPVSTEDARGAGQPRLRRPLEVTHLP